MKNSKALPSSSPHTKAIETIRQLSINWKSSFVPRKDISLFTGGLYSPGYFGNLDSKGIGVPDSFRIGRQVCYPVDSLINWLLERLDANQAICN